MVDNDGSFPIRMTSLNIDRIEAEADKVISMAPDSMEIEFGDPCINDGWHSSHCQVMMDHLSEPCILDQVSVAQQRQRRLAVLDLLTKCGRSPSEANGLRVLEGMATDSCIYEAE